MLPARRETTQGRWLTAGAEAVGDDTQPTEEAASHREPLSDRRWRRERGKRSQQRRVLFAARTPSLEIQQLNDGIDCQVRIVRRMREMVSMSSRSFTKSNGFGTMRQLLSCGLWNATVERLSLLKGRGLRAKVSIAFNWKGEKGNALRRHHRPPPPVPRLPPLHPCRPFRRPSSEPSWPQSPYLRLQIGRAHV